MKKAIKLISWLLLIGLFVGIFYVARNSKDIEDWWRLRSYVAPQEVVAIADRAGLSDYGRRLLYVNEPKLLDKTVFRQNCTIAEATIVLGCYISNQGIYLYDVTDERLTGVEEVTAAHEVLHAAYDRLSPKEKEAINALLLQEFDKIDDERLERTIASYRDRDPSVVPNELHSIIGTEMRSISVDLENHYAAYFSDRSKVVTLAEAYTIEFERREDQIAEYDNRLSQLQGEITRIEADINVQSETLTNERSRIEGLRDDVSAYNRAVVTFNKSIASYNTQLGQLRTLIDSYNGLVEQRNAIAAEERSLIDSIDTRAQPL